MVKQAHQLLNALQKEKKKKNNNRKSKIKLYIYTHLYAYMSGPLSVLFGFLSTPSQKWQTERSQCLVGRLWALKTGHNIFVSFLLDALKVQSQE